MEQWEIDLRAELEQTIPPGMYQIGGDAPGEIIMWTGRGGYIDYRVALHRVLLDFINPEPKDLQEEFIPNYAYDRHGTLTVEKIREMFEDCFSPEQKKLLSSFDEERYRKSKPPLFKPLKLKPECYAITSEKINMIIEDTFFIETSW